MKKFIIDENSEDSFWTWSTQYYPDEEFHYYVRLDRMESGSCNTIFQVDYGRFRTYEEAQAYIDTLGDPYEAARREISVFNKLKIETSYL